MSGAGIFPLRLRVMDWSPLGQPRCIGAASYAVDINRMRRECASNATAISSAEAARKGGPMALKEVSLPLRGTRGGSVTLMIGIAPKPYDGSALPRAQHHGSGGAEEGKVRRDLTADEWDGYSETEGSGAESDGTLDEDSEEEEGADVSTLPERYVTEGSSDAGSRERVNDGESAPRLEGRPGGLPGRKTSEETSMAHLMQVAKIQRERQREQAKHATEQTAMSRSLRDAREDLEMERERRQFELRRALIEGAVFSCHTKRKPGGG